MSSPTSSPSRLPLWLWPHTLSLEAPLVAIVWTLAVSRVNDLQVMPGVLPGLALIVWLIYILDRILDTVGVSHRTLSPRHRFYRRHRLLLLMLLVPAILATVIWLALWVVPVGLLWQVITLSIPILLYLVFYSGIGSPRLRQFVLQLGSLLVLFVLQMLPLESGIKLGLSAAVVCLHFCALAWRWHERVPDLFRKEIAAGLLFALGCTTWTRFSALGDAGLAGYAEMLLLAVLFTSNLHLITLRELPASRLANPWPHLLGSGFIALTLITLSLLGYLPEKTASLAFAVLFGLSLLAYQWQRRHTQSAELYRVLADLALLIPAALLLLVLW